MSCGSGCAHTLLFPGALWATGVHLGLAKFSQGSPGEGVPGLVAQWKGAGKDARYGGRGGRGEEPAKCWP